ncbi:MAG: hypothetical protein NC177_14420 [Ruminococcus flavefaciens]|nr:hypothetical protein [Ruminococcus flavefaciens]
MSYFLFNGVNSDDLGLMVTSPPVRPTWELESQEFTIAGKTVKYTQKSKTYSNQTMTIETFLDDISQKNLQKIYHLLQEGGKLWLSSSPAEYLEVTAQPPDIKPVAYFAGECILKFTVKPFARAVNPTTVEITSENSYKSVNNSGTLFSEPLISFCPQSTKTVITVNGSDFTVHTPENCTPESTIFIDSEEQIVYFQLSDGNFCTCLQYTEGDLPLFHTGENYVKYSGAVHDFKVNVRERFL